VEERERVLRTKLSEVLPFLNEKQRRVLAASEAKSFGRGGVQTVARISGISRQTIYHGLADLEKGNVSDRIRRPGGGRKKLREQSPELVKNIEGIIDEATRGDPESPLRWTCKSVRNVEKSLVEAGYSVSYRTVARILNEQEYNLTLHKKIAMQMHQVLPCTFGTLCAWSRSHSM
jgi:transposase